MLLLSMSSILLYVCPHTDRGTEVYGVALGRFSLRFSYLEGLVIGMACFSYAAECLVRCMTCFRSAADTAGDLDIFFFSWWYGML